MERIMENNFDIYKELFSLSSFHDFSSEKEIYVMDKLKQVLLSRMEPNSIRSFEGCTSISERIPNFFDYKGADTVSLREYIEKHSDLWDMSSQYLGQEFGYYELNNSGYVTWDCYDFYILGKALMYGGSFDKIDNEILEEVFDIENEYFAEEEDMEEQQFTHSKEQMVAFWLDLAKTCSKAMQEKKTEDDKLQTFVDDMRSVLYDDLVSEEVFFENFDTLLLYLFGTCEGTYRETVTIRSKNLYHYLTNRNNIKDCPEKDLIEQAFSVISSPFDEGWYGLEGFTSLDHDYQWFTTTFFLGEYSSEKLSIHHVKPFFFLAMKKIDELVPTLLENNSLFVVSAP